MPTVRNALNRRLYSMPSDQNLSRRGFTVVELIIVITVIAALAALLYPALSLLQERAKYRQTQQLVIAVEAAINAAEGERAGRFYGTTIDPSTSEPLTYRRWDMNDDTLLDGKTYADARPAGLAVDPAFDGLPVSALAEVAEYEGAALAMSFNADQLDEHYRIVDLYGEPLRVIFDRERFPSRGFGVFSVGADRLPAVSMPGEGTPEERDDNILSWSTSDDE